jgi:polysaccharide deacetylase family protein (PEP-CTERM system associated)
MNILTFDIEDWFHILDNPYTKGIEQWSNFESRIDQNMEIIFNLLEANNQKATFFVVGWMAEKHPEQIRKIVEKGHEIGSHTYLHQLVYKQSHKVFKDDLAKSINILEHCTGQKVKYFRAPGFSINRNTPWAFEALLENGISIDSSVFPASRAHGGFEEFGTAKPAIIECKGMQLKEFPINILPLLSKSIIFSGGGYFRLFPYQMIRKFTEQSDYVMTYFHPRDFDANQPMVPGLSWSRKFKSYYGLKSTKRKLDSWLKDFSFLDVKQADKIIDWNTTQIIKVSD